MPRVLKHLVNGSKINRTSVSPVLSLTGCTSMYLYSALRTPYSKYFQKVQSNWSISPPWANRKKAKPPLPPSLPLESNHTATACWSAFDLSGRTCAACVSCNVIFLSPSSCITVSIRNRTAEHTITSWLTWNSASPGILGRLLRLRAIRELLLDAK